MLDRESNSQLTTNIKIKSCTKTFNKQKKSRIFIENTFVITDYCVRIEQLYNVLLLLLVDWTKNYQHKIDYIITKINIVVIINIINRDNVFCLQNEKFESIEC